jgi:ferredoxin-NADP reductase
MGGNVAPVPGNVHRATLADRRRLFEENFELSFRLSDEDAQLSWRTGQFLSIHCGQGADGLPILRSYSIASRPQGGPLRLIVQRIAAGAASQRLVDMAPGGEITFTGPMGFFVLDLQHAGDVVFVATGTGIAPILPMAAEALARGESGRVHLYWGLRSDAAVPWAEEELRPLAHPLLTTTLCISQPSGAWAGTRGRVNQPVLDLLPHLAAPTFYLCGNGAMIRELKAKLVERGIDRKRQIRTEAFFD